MLLALLVDPALACGGLAPMEGALAASDAQQALFDIGTDAITATYRAHYTGDAADFAWVIAVPGTIASVAEGDALRLDAIASASAPWVDIDPAVADAAGGGCGCTDATNLSKGDAAGDYGDTGVTVTGSGFAGDFSYTTLAASDAGSLTSWLTEHGYDTSRIAGAIDAYVADPLGYEWVAVQLRPDVPQTPGEGVVLDPLAITYGAAQDGALHALYPARLARSSTTETVRTEIFVLATGTADLAGGWTAVANEAETDERAWDLVGPDYVDPDGVYADWLYGLGGAQRQMYLAYAGSYVDEGADRWLTRYDTIVAPDTNTTDPLFTDSGEHTEARTVIYLMNETDFEDQYDTGALWLVPLGLAAGVGLRRRR